MNDIKIKKIYRSKRRTIALEITPQAEVIVRAPKSVPENRIWDFINAKHVWILTKQKFIQDRLGKILKRNFVDGEEILFLGKAYRLKIIEGKSIKLSNYLEFPKLFLKDNPEKHLIEWYRKQALAVIARRCEYYAQKMGVKYSAIKINNAKKRLGSCSSRDSLNFSWLLMLTPQRVLDYVVVHELCHIEIKNHSDKFWNKVQTCFPNYLEQKTWLKENSFMLKI